MTTTTDDAPRRARRSGTGAAAAAPRAAYPLRLPASLRRAVTRLAAEEGTSVNQFLATAAAEKVAALDTAEAFFAARRARAGADPAATLLAVLDRPGGGSPPEPGDEVPPDLAARFGLGRRGGA